MELNKKTLRRIFLGIVGCILLFWVLNAPERITKLIATITKILSPFVVGAVLAFVLNVPMRGIEKLLSGIKKPGLRRALAMVLTVLAVLLVLTGAIYLLAPQIRETIKSLVEKLPEFFNNIRGNHRFRLNHTKNNKRNNFKMRFRNRGKNIFKKFSQITC